MTAQRGESKFSGRINLTAMKDIENSCKIALVQAEPVMFDKSGSLKKTLQWIAEAAAQKPDLIVFPELFIPGYPVGMNFGFCIVIAFPGRRSFSSLQRRLRKRDLISALAFPNGMP